MKKFKFFAPLALIGLLSAPVYSQSAPSSNSHTALSIVGTPDDADLARQIFPDVPNQSSDLLIAAGTADKTVRIGIRGHESTIQVMSDATNVRGSFSINGIPLALAVKAPTGPCTEPAFILSGDGLTACDTTTHSFVTR